MKNDKDEDVCRFSKLILIVYSIVLVVFCKENIMNIIINLFREGFNMGIIE